MSYYNEKRKACIFIDEKIKKVLNGEGSLNIPKLIIDVTSTYAVGENFIIKRVSLWKKTHPINLRLEEDFLIFVEG